MVCNIDEHARVRRRIENLRRPPHAISVEQASYLRDEYGARQEQPHPEDDKHEAIVALLVCCFMFAAMVIVVWLNVE